MIYKLLISTAWNAEAVAKFEAISVLWHLALHTVRNRHFLKNAVSWDVTPWRLTEVYRPSREICCLHHGYGLPESSCLLSPLETPYLSQILSEPEVRKLSELTIFKTNIYGWRKASKLWPFPSFLFSIRLEMYTDVINLLDMTPVVTIVSWLCP